jgi:DNA polymerase-3 subunit epsilon
MRQIFLDTETTGLDPANGHRIVEIGAVELRQRHKTGNHFQRYLNPQRDSDPEAERIHGLTTAFLSDKPLFAEVVDEFLEFVKDAELLIHNATFDVRFLNSELERIGREPLETHCLRIVDTVAMARDLNPGKRSSLDALCERYGIDNRHRTFHGALLDAELLGEVYLAMTRGQDSLMMDDPTDTPMREDYYHGGGSRRNLKVVYASVDEIDAHLEYLGRLNQEISKSGKTALWKD